jgi:hypothetical protein
MKSIFNIPTDETFKMVSKAIAKMSPQEKALHEVYAVSAGFPVQYSSCYD